MRRLLLAALTAATLVATGIVLSETTPPGGTHSGASELSGLRNAATPTPTVAASAGDVTPNGFWSFWKKVRNALKKLRELIDAILDHTNDAPGSRTGGYASAPFLEGIDGPASLPVRWRGGHPPSTPA